MKNYIGSFIWNSDCACPDFVCNDGTVIEHVDIQLKPDVIDLVEEPLMITLDGDTLVSYQRDPSVARAPRSTTHKIALVRVGNGLDEDDLESVRKRAKTMQDNFNRSYQGHRVVEVVGFIMPFEEGMSFSLYSDPLFRGVQNFIDDDSFTHYQVVGGSHSSYCGIARLGGTRALTFNPWQCKWKTSLHEYGHNFGLHHAGKNKVEYGERARIMGTGNGRRWFNAPHLYHKDGISQHQVKELLESESAHVYIAGFNTLELAVPNGAHRMILLRQSEPHKAISVSLDGDHLDIHVPYFEGSQSWSKTNQIETLQAGQFFEVAGRKIHYEGIENGLASIVIDDHEDRLPVPTYPEPNAISFDGCSGAWGNPQWGAQGVHVFHTEGSDTVDVVWLTWDYSYNTRWYKGTLNISDNVATGELETGGFRANAEVKMYFNDDTNGMFYAKVDDELFATPLRRVSRAQPSPTSGIHELNDGTFITMETSDRGVEFGYILETEFDRLVSRYYDYWKMYINGTVYAVEGGMRGVKVNPKPTVEDIGAIIFDGDNIELLGISLTKI